MVTLAFGTTALVRSVIVPSMPLGIGREVEKEST
jgi:hypothetical protein